MLFVWNALISLLWPLLYLYRPFRGTIAQRRGKFGLGAYDPQRDGLRVLVNAVSAGEVNAVAPFIRQLRRLRPDAQVVLLTTTRSGAQMAEQKLAGDVELVAWFPLIDLPTVSRDYLDRLQPQLYVTTESELWPNIQSQCRQRGIATVLVNGRLYLHNKQGLRRWVVQQLLDQLDLIVCQDEQQRHNYLTFGLPADKLAVSGNIKFDYAAPEWSEAEQQQWLQRFDAAAERQVVVAGSTHTSEEELILGALDRVPAEGTLPQPRLVLAPRHIDRAPEAAALARQHGRLPTLLSAYKPGADWDVLVVDAYGVLADLYRLADVVIMGGTFHAKVGGHNILEATALGKPVIVGPHVFSIAAQVEMLEGAVAIVHVVDGSGLATRLAALLTDPQAGSAIGAAAQLATEANRGSAERAARIVLDRLAG